MKSARTIIVVVAALGAVAALSMACGGDDGESSGDTSPDPGSAELAPPVRIELTEETAAAGRGAEMGAEMGAAMDAGDSLGELSIAPGPDMIDGSVSTDEQYPTDWVWAVIRFTAGEALGALPTNDVAYHYPPGAQADVDQVRALAAAFGLEGDPVPGRPDSRAQWVVGGASDASGARLEVSDDATLSWWLTGGDRRPDLVSGAPGALGRVDYASGWLAEAIPTGPYPLIGLEEALERLAAQQGSWPIAIASAGDPGADAPVASPGAEVSDAGGSESGATEPVEPLVPDYQEPPVEYEVEMVSVSATLWSSWATDGSVWLIPAYRFESADGAVYTIAAITDEYLVQMDPYALPDPGPPVVDPPFIEDPFDGMDLDGVREALVGLTLSEAEELLYENGWMWTLRAVRVDGEDLPVTADYQPDRVNVVTESGEIVDVDSFG